MKRERLYRIHIQEIGKVTVDYYLTIDEQNCYDQFGVCLVKMSAGDLVEEFASIDHVWHDRKDAVRWIRRLAAGKAMPVSLADIIEDSLN